MSISDHNHGVFGATRRDFLKTASAATLAGLIGLRLTTGPAGAAETPQRGGTLTMARTGDVTSFEPVMPADAMSIWAKLLVYQLLLRPNLAGDGVEPDLAERWDVSEDQRVYTFHLRADAAFSDGAPVTAEDVMFSFDRVMKDPASPWLTLYPRLTMEAPDARTVVFRLEEDYAPFLAAVSLHSACIVPKARFTELGAAGFGEKPIGSGPFVMSEWKKGESLTFTRNPHFWDAGRPYLETVVLRVVADDNVRMLQVQSGDLDVATSVPFNQIDRLKQTGGVAVQVAPFTRIDWIQFNNKLPVFQDAKVRQALNYAVNKDAIIRAVLFGYGEAPTSFLPKMLLTDLEKPLYPYDLERARQLMAESSQPKGFAATLKTAAGDTIGAQVAQIVQQMLLPLGVKLSIQPIEAGTQFQQIQTGDYEMALIYMASDIYDPIELTVYAVQSDSGSNSAYSSYSNPEVDRLVKLSQSQVDAEVRRATYKQIQTMVAEDAPFLWLYWTPVVTAVRNAVQGFAISPTGNYRLEDVWKS